MALTSNGLVSYCKDVLKKPTAYMWGGLMRTITVAYVNQLAAMYPSQYTATRCQYLYRISNQGYGCDCVGLIKSYLFGGVGSPKYVSKWDVNTNGLYAAATEKGDIQSLPEIPGVVLYMPGHVGVYIGNGECIECTLGNYGDGVVKTKVKGRGWTDWLKVPWIEYPEIKPDTNECPYCCPYCEQGWYPYTVVTGDSYWSIAEKTLGNGSRYMEICNLNNVTPTTVIHTGDILKIPLRKE